MENNKYNKYYSKKAVSVLIGQIISHRITGATIDKEWYEALKNIFLNIILLIMTKKSLYLTSKLKDNADEKQTTTTAQCS